MENGVTWWVRSTMRSSGAMEYITPLQRATESSTTPKSVMKTTVDGAGGGRFVPLVDWPATADNRINRRAGNAVFRLRCMIVSRPIRKS